MDIPLLPSGFAGYLPTVDLDAAVAALAPRLVAYATGRTGCRSTGEDVAQDALTALVVRWTRHGPPESPEAFAFAIARRRAGRAVLRRALTRPLEFVLAAQAEPTGVDAYEQRAELQTVMATMRRLRSANREVLLLRAAGELSLNEIAIVTRSSVARRQDAAASCSVEADRAARRSRPMRDEDRLSERRAASSNLVLRPGDESVRAGDCRRALAQGGSASATSCWSDCERSCRRARR